VRWRSPQPLAAAAGLGAAARRASSSDPPMRLLDLADVDLVAFDKTGTVTAGNVAVLAADDSALRIAAGLERYSMHPIARAIVEEAVNRDIALPRGEDVREEVSFGIRGRVDGVQWQLASGGPGSLLLSDEGGREHRIILGDVIRPDAAATVRRLGIEGLDVALLTGDHAEVADRIAAAAGIGTVKARCNPEQKAAWIEARQREGRHVLFAGDGLQRRAGARKGGRWYRDGQRCREQRAGGRWRHRASSARADPRGAAHGARVPPGHPEQPAPVACLQRAGGVGGRRRFHQSAGGGAAHAAVERPGDLGRAPRRAPCTGRRPVNAIVFLLPIALGLGGIFAALFLRAVKKGQFDDLDDPPQRMLQERD
jgi:cbb3-type cytochrome oxidase maturation protein